MPRVNAGADRELRAIAVAKALQADRGAALLVGSGDRFALAEATVEADREAARCVVADRAAHSDDAADVRQQRSGLRVAVAGGEDDQPDRGSGRAEGLLERGGRDELRATVCALEEQAVSRLAALRPGHAAEIAARRRVGMLLGGGAPGAPWPLKWTIVGLSLRSSRSRSSGSAAHRVTNSKPSREPLRSSSAWIARASRSSASRSVPSGLAAKNRMVCFIGSLRDGLSVSDSEEEVRLAVRIAIGALARFELSRRVRR